MNFCYVLNGLKDGKKYTRKGWNGKGLYIQLQIPDENSKMTRPYIYLVSPPKSTSHYGAECNTEQLVPWLPSQTDLFAEDWDIIE